jgi:hypothetical protein
VLYFDASALIKHYVVEKGTDKVHQHLRDEDEASRAVFTSALTYAEIHSALARRAKDGSLSAQDFIRARTSFDAEWALSLSAVDLGTGVLGIVRNTVERFPLRGADLVQLASAVWLRDMANKTRRGDYVLFLSSDNLLNKAAAGCGLEIFNPETAS